MDKDVQTWIDTAFSTEGIWDDVKDVTRDNIKVVLPRCFEHGTKDYERVDGYDNLPWKARHHLDIRIEMYNDNKQINKK